MCIGASIGQSQHCKSHTTAAAECQQHPCTVLPAKVCQSIFLLTTTAATILQPLYRSTCINQHVQLRTGGFYWCKWVDQLRNDSTRPIGDLWRRAVDRGHGGATTRRPSSATWNWWWWKFYSPCALADGSQRIWIREKTLEFSSTVLSTLSPFLYFSRKMSDY